jgi:hypothetical protein
MSVLPEIKLTGSADKVVWVYGAVLGIIVLVAIYFLGRSTGKKQGTTPVENTTVNASNLTFPNSQYISFAEELRSALDSIFGFGTNTDEVYGVFKNMKTTDDIMQLVNAFGTHRMTYSISYLGLGAYIHEGMSDSEVQQINTILSGNGINYQF